MSKAYKFKKGDKVVCKNAQYEGLEEGKIYTVKSHEGDFVHCKELETGYFDFCFEPSADDLFEKLGYKKIENKIQITYVKPYENIEFLLNVKKIEYHFLRGSTFLVQTMQELQAINQKVKELRLE